jgi:amino acid transporter
MKTRIFGILFILLGVLTKSIFGHLAEHWSTIEIISVILCVIGLTIVFYKLIVKSDNRKGIKFRKKPLKWIFKRPLFIYILIIPSIVSLFFTGKFLNDKLKNHYLEKEISETKATFIGFSEQSYLGKYGTSTSEKFAILRYNTNCGIITQGLKNEEFEKNRKYFKSELNIEKRSYNGENMNTRKATIIYSLKYPSFFRIKK